MKGIKAVLFAVLIWSMQAADACRFTQTLTKEMESQADNVFRGKVMLFDKLPGGFAAKITFKVDKTIKGQDKKQWEIIWINGNFGLPNSIDEFKKTYGTLTEVGVLMPSTNSKRSFMEPPEGFKTYPIVLQGPCTTPFLKPISPSD